MSPELYGRLEDLFHAARRLPPPQREALLSELALREAPLSSELRRLLDHIDVQHPSSDWLASGGGASLLAASLNHVAGERPRNGTASPQPTWIGPFRILREIGHGGMGVVYEAEQQDPRRRVALKVIREWTDSPTQRERFRREAQMLGRLRHRGVAQIFAAHTSPQPAELPYFVMELIEGPPLLQFATERGLSVRQRLDLLAELCDALEHVHRAGLVHRDIKPGNVLVETATTPSGELPGDADDSIAARCGGQPKILDFGIARCADLWTQTEQNHARLVGTIPYMSPEQICGKPVDAQSDVYALGVIAFELLTGRPPHDVSVKELPEAARIIRDEEPERLGAIDPRFRGDVELVVSKALEHDLRQRYASAAEFGADIRRYLADLPVRARTPSIYSRIRRYWRRRRLVATSGALALAGAIMLSVAAMLTFWPEPAGVAHISVNAITSFHSGGLWLVAHPSAEAYAFDEFFSGYQPKGGCLAGDGVPVSLRLAGGRLALSSFDRLGKPMCAISDSSKHASVSDAIISGRLVMEFEPPITAFYGLYGSVAVGATVTLDLYALGEHVGSTTSATSGREVHSLGHGFSSTVPIDRIEFTTTDGERAMLGAFRFLDGIEPGLGSREIPAYGSEVPLDFACVFESVQ